MAKHSFPVGQRLLLDRARSKLVLWGMIQLSKRAMNVHSPTHSAQPDPLYHCMLIVTGLLIKRWLQVKNRDFAKARTVCFLIPDHSRFIYSESQKSLDLPR